MRIIVPSFWLAHILRHVFRVTADVWSDAVDLLQMVQSRPLDCVVLGHHPLRFSEEATSTRFVETVRNVPMIVYGAWSSYGHGGYDSTLLRELIDVQWGGFDQGFFRFRQPDVPILAFPVEDLPPVASRHIIRPSSPKHDKVVLETDQKEPLSILQDRGTCRRLYLAFPLHPGGGQQLFFCAQFPAFLRHLFALLNGPRLPAPEPDIHGQTYLEACRGALSRDAINLLIDKGAPAHPHDRLEMSAILAAEHRYYDLASQIESKMAAVKESSRDKLFHAARAAQFDGFERMLHGDLIRASRSFEVAAGAWLDRHDPPERVDTIDVDFSRSLKALSAFASALASWQLSPGELSGWADLVRAAGKLARISGYAGSHAAVRGLNLVPLLLVAADWVRHARGASPRMIDAAVNQALRFLIEFGNFASLLDRRAVIFAELLLEHSRNAGRLAAMARVSRKIDSAYERGDIASRDWLLLATVLGILMQQETPITVVGKNLTLFLSYSSEDSEIVHECASALERDGMNVFIDDRALSPGQGLKQGLARGVTASDVFVFFVSPSSILRGSSWLIREINDAVTGVPMFVPVVLSDVRLPALLATRVALDGRKCTGEEIARRLAEAIRATAGRSERE